MNHRRVELQLRLLSAFVHAERTRGSVDSLNGFAERSAAILDRVAIAIHPEADPELLELLATVRAEIRDLLPVR